jgi:nucleoid-associated protein YgaU
MPNDAKLGLVVGVGVVIAVAIVFFRPDGTPSSPLTGNAAAASVHAGPPASSAGRAGASRSAKTKGTGNVEPEKNPATPAVRHHTVKEGDTLFRLAELYYGDQEKSDLIYQANRGVLKSAEELPPGTELVIPN